MSYEDILDALNRIEYQLENGYLDIHWLSDEEEMYVVREALKEYRANHNL